MTVYELEQAYQWLIAEQVMHGDIDRARRHATEWAESRDGFPTRAELGAGYEARLEYLRA